MVEDCTDNLYSYNQERDKYGFGWSKFNANYTPPNGYQSIYNAFQYKTADELQGSPYEGQYSTYEGSGYVYELRGQLSYIQGNLSLLRAMNWIDRQTRAVFVEFAVYNPNVKLVMVSTILVEFLLSGSILSVAKFDPLNLFGDVSINSGGFSFNNASEIIFMALVVYFMVVELCELMRQGIGKYVREFWNYIEWAIIVTAWISFAMFLYRLRAAEDVLDFFMVRLIIYSKT